MEPNKRDRIIDKIIKIGENSVYFKKKDSSREIRSHGLKFFVVNHENLYNPLLPEFYTEEYVSEKNFSKDHVFDFIDDILAKILTLGISIIKILKKKYDYVLDYFDKEYKDSFQNATVYIPISGMELNLNKFEIGNIVFEMVKSDQIKLITDNFKILARKNPFLKNKPNFKEELEYWVARISKLENMICAKYTTFADLNTASNLAHQELENVLDLLNFSTFLFHHRTHNVSVGHEGEVVRVIQNTIVHNENFQDYRLKSKAQGNSFLFDISKKEIEEMKKVGIVKVGNILKRNRLTKFEKTILLGIHWFADSRSQSSIENQFLSLMITLELFLTTGAERISNQIAENASRLIFNGVETRLTHKDRLKKLYQKRSTIVHGTGGDSPTDKDLDYLEEIVFNLIVWMIKNSDKYSDNKELHLQIEKWKMS